MDRSIRPSSRGLTAFSLQPNRLTTFSLQPAGASRRPRAGFTLIEMLVVVIIITILAGMVLGLLKVSGDWGAKAQTNLKLGKLRAAIEEFYAEYGQYPPVPNYGNGQPFYYEYPGAQTKNGNLGTAVSDPTTDWKSCPIFTFGLMSFLVPRYTSHASLADNAGGLGAVFSMNQWNSYNQSIHDQQRDINACNRWNAYIQDILTVTYKPESVNKDGVHCYTNLVLSVNDGWGREFHYQSPPPYQSYKLWSVGRDGQDGTADDISTGPGY